MRPLKYCNNIVSLFSGILWSVYGASLLVILLLILFSCQDSGSSVTVNVPMGSKVVEDTPVTDAMVDDDTSDDELTDTLPHAKPAMRNPKSTTLTKRDAVIDNTNATRPLVANSAAESAHSERPNNDPPLPQENQTGPGDISDYINLVFNLSHVKPDDDLDSVQVMQKHLNLTQCLIYQIENEKMAYALFDLWKVYLALHNIWFPTKFEKYLITAIEGVNHWSFKDLTLNNHIKEDLVKATNNLVTMKIVLAVTNITQMSMIQKVLKITDLAEQLTAGTKVIDITEGIHRDINSRKPAYQERADFHAKHIYYPALERYLNSVIFTMNARAVCFKVYASL